MTEAPVKLSGYEIRQIREFLMNHATKAEGREPFFVTYYDGADKQIASWATINAMMSALEKYPKQKGARYGVTIPGDSATITIP